MVWSIAKNKMANLKIDNVVKRFGKTEVIRGVSMDIVDGEFIVIVGPSGCGKSTLLRMVAGLEGVSGGEIKINGQRVNEKEPMDRDIAMVFQNYALYPHMSVRQNMAYGLKIAKLSKSVIKQKVDHAAKLLQLEEFLDRKPRELSGGQRQRVAMGRAIVREPAVFLFDEPLSNLDAKLRVQMRLEIKQLQSDLGVTSLYVTHDQVEAMTMADRMVVMNDGRAEQIGTPLEVYEHPQTLFAAQFIGSPAMNILHATFENNRVILQNGSELAVAAASQPRASNPGASNPAASNPGPSNDKPNLMVGIRPEHLYADRNGSLELELRSREPLGATTLFHGSLADSDQQITANLQGIYAAPAESRVRFHADPAHIHLFDAQSGQCLR